MPIEYQEPDVRADEAEHAQRVTLQHHACDQARRVADLAVENAKVRQWLRESNDRAGDLAGRVLKLKEEREELRAWLAEIKGQEPVRLTDAAIAEAFLSRCPAHLRGEHDVRDMQARPDVMAMGRAIEAAVLAANGLEACRG